MIKAKKDQIFSRAFHLYNTYWLLKRSFSTIYLKGSFNQDSSALVLVNHSSWWDGLVTFYLTETICPFDSYAMMSEEGMKKFPFFRRIGAFSVNAASSRSVIETLHYSTNLLANQKAVWMFPQGAEQPLEKRPLEFQSGSAYLSLKVPSTPVYIVTYYYTMSHEQKPRLYIEISSPIDPADLSNQTRQDVTTMLETKMTHQLEQQRTSIATSSLSGYSELLSGNRSVSDWFGFLSGSKK
ncbi:lysophospholipid acyltransferase family protein [Alkalicoccobacillus murimartini]|uniref:1-acyl-sn-glycerol-3-phosphate acyltransferase n=1 Tax=Alkalicoccobacillus murimartini TaxID=171685 RepID=A0ABT9YE37_9BACI|nr:lysophospholipid acyltransferase family protein [Alkalicoccobacillus murimartini]MDQ0205755.1 1-acyl-sn-glycerol-3-phosphate acyltransferase [Alkalicoccobacillus murimartini]